MRMLVLLALLISSRAFGATLNFEAGQVWAYQTRPGEEDSTLLIDKVEDDPKLGRIYHISVSRIQIKGSAATFTNELPHIPVSLQTLTASCTHLIGHSDPNPDYLPGYRLWRQAFEAGRAGKYSITIAEILDLTEKMVQQPRTGT
jgi:hypothetical protein